MNSAQVTAFQLGICVKNSKSCVLQKCIVNSFPRIRNISVRDKPLFGLKSLKPLRAGGKGMSENSDEVLTLIFSYNFVSCCYFDVFCRKIMSRTIRETIRKDLDINDRTL